MTSQAGKKCCVCGAPSTMRCSACSKAGVDLYFCSTEHQKLVWFAHKPICGPLKADFMDLPYFTPAETRILQSPAFLHTFSKRRARGTSAATFDQAIYRLEREYHLIPGSFMRNLHHINEWLETLAIQPQVCGGFRMVANGALSDFVHSPDGSTNDPLELPAHAFALDVHVWHSTTQPEVPWPQLRTFLHGSTIWAGLLRVLAGRVAVTGVDSTFVTPEFVAANLERLLQSIQTDLNLAIDVTGGGLLPLFSQPLHSVPAMSRYNVRISTMAGGPASNRIFVDRPGDGAHSERLKQTAT